MYAASASLWCSHKCLILCNHIHFLSRKCMQCFVYTGLLRCINSVCYRLLEHINVLRSLTCELRYSCICCFRFYYAYHFTACNKSKVRLRCWSFMHYILAVLELPVRLGGWTPLAHWSDPLALVNFNHLEVAATAPPPAHWRWMVCFLL